MGDKNKISFCAMTSIMKTASLRENNCHDWVATEKVHGASFQFYTSDGDTIHLGSRTRSLDGNVSFLKCNLAEFKERHSEYVKDLYNQVKTVKRWRHYVEFLEEFTYDSDDDEDYEAVSETKDECLEDIEGGESTIENVRVTEESRDNNVEVRIYGELYGGGGVNKDVKPAVQKEIIYSDEFRFYVFGITINKKWVSIVEMNDLCKNAGFPYYATPVCEPMDTLEELKNFLISSGFMNSKSRLTDRTDDFKTKIEGVVMSPLTRPDYKRHAIKLLSAAFTDVRETVKGKKVQVNYCTKARYLSVISKLDIPEREDTEMVISMFINDIEKESGEPLSINKRKGSVKAVRGWLAKDGYIKDVQTYQAGKTTEPTAQLSNELSTDHICGASSEFTKTIEEEDTDFTEVDMPFGDLFGDS